MTRPLPQLPNHAELTYRHLPHLDVPGVPTFVTFRLNGSLPETVRKSLIAQAQQWQKSNGTSEVLAHKRLFALMDKYLDEATVQLAGPCHLKNIEVCNGFIKHMSWGMTNFRYLVHAYCIMSNHVHLLLETLPKIPIKNNVLSWHGSCLRKQHVESIVDQTLAHTAVTYWTLSEVMQGLKSCSAREINRILNQSGTFWQDESFDHVIRDEAEYFRVVSYIENNPVKAGLCREATDWPFSSASAR